MLFLKAHIANVALAGGVTGPPALPDTLLVVQTEAADTLQLGNSLGQPALNRARVHSVCGDNPSRVSLVCHVGIFMQYSMRRTRNASTLNPIIAAESFTHSLKHNPHSFIPPRLILFISHSTVIIMYNRSSRHLLCLLLLHLGPFLRTDRRGRCTPRRSHSAGAQECLAHD